MAKITVFFKDKPIDSKLFEKGIIRIGRDETNDIHVDSLAIAPAHAAIIIDKDSSRIKQLNDEFPLVINGEHFKEANLVDGDILAVGKHAIVFNTDEQFVRSSNEDNLSDKDLQQLNQDIEPTVKFPEANMQVMDGKHIGRMIPLKKAMTRLGSKESGIAVIARRKDGYFISVLEGKNNLKVNANYLGENTVKLNNNDTVLIDQTSMQFFLN